MKALRAVARALFGKLPFCALNGGIIGVIAGFFMAMLLLAHQSSVFTAADVSAVILLLALAAWLFVLLVVGVWLRYGPLRIAVPALVNALVTTALTVLVTLWVGVIGLAAPLGWAIGTVVGSILCWLCGLGVFSLRGVPDVR